MRRRVEADTVGRFSMSDAFEFFLDGVPRDLPTKLLDGVERAVILFRRFSAVLGITSDQALARAEALQAHGL